MDFFSALPQGCVSDILSLTSPRDACQSSAVSWWLKSAADSDAVWGRFFPSDHSEIMSRSVFPVAFSTKKHLYLHLADHPILLDDGNLSFALDKESGKKCFMLGARALCIIWGNCPQYWAWTALPSHSRFSEVAQLQEVCWLDIQCKIESRTLSPKTTYVAYLVFKIAEGNYGLDHLPATASVGFVGIGGAARTVYLKPHDDFPLPPDERVPQMRKDGWMEIELGEFLVDEGDSGEVQMRLLGTDGHSWKSGLIVEGMEFRPKV